MRPASSTERHRKLSDEAYEQAFRDCTLRPLMFTHEAHLRLAWIHISSYGEAQAIANITQQIQAYADSVGATGKYNATVTVAAIKVMCHFMQRSKSESFYELMEEFPQLLTGFKELLAQHYSMDIFRNPEAKAQYLEPDLAPF